MVMKNAKAKRRTLLISSRETLLLECVLTMECLAVAMDVVLILMSPLWLQIAAAVVR